MSVSEATVVETEVNLQRPDRTLEPLPFHHQLVQYLKAHEPHAWELASSASEQAKQGQEVRDAMLRQTYRLEPGGHPAVFEACTGVMSALGIDAPVNIYQAADGSMNAALVYTPGEVNLVFYGPTLERLAPEELVALIGHELAHYKLWSVDRGDHYTASRVLDLAQTFPDAARSHFETARLLSLHTEVFADRGAALAAGAIEPAVSMLVKVMTGLGTVDPSAYLRQAAELEGNPTVSEGSSHPESFLRARALQLWWQDAGTLSAWIDQRLRGPISLERLDLLRQAELARLTRGFLARFASLPEDTGQSVLAMARGFFPGFSADEPPVELGLLAPDRIDASTRDYLIALLFDCAMVDPDLTETVLLRGARLAGTIGAEEAFRTALKRDLKWSKRTIDSLMARAAKAD